LFLSQIWVYGDSTKPFLIAIGTGNRASITDYAASLGLTGSFEELCGHLQILKTVMEDLQRIAKESKLQGFEMIRALLIRPKEFTVDEDLLTPTMKLKRAQLRKFFQKDIAELYAQGEKTFDVVRPAAASSAVPPSPVNVSQALLTEWQQWLTAAGVDAREAAAAAHQLAKFEYKVAEAKQLSAFHLHKKPFEFSAALVNKIVEHAAK